MNLGNKEHKHKKALHQFLEVYFPTPVRYRQVCRSVHK